METLEALAQVKIARNVAPRNKNDYVTQAAVYSSLCHNIPTLLLHVYNEGPTHKVVWRHKQGRTSHSPTYKKF